MKGFYIDFKGKYENLQFIKLTDAIERLLELYDEDKEIREKIQQVLANEFISETYLDDPVDEQFELAGELADLRYQEIVSKKLLEENDG